MKLERSAAAAVGVVVLVWAMVVRAQGLPAAAPETVGMSSQRLGQISTVLKREIEQGNLPGAVVLVARKGQLGTRTRSASRTRRRASPCPWTRSSASTR